MSRIVGWVLLILSMIAAVVGIAYLSWFYITAQGRAEEASRLVIEQALQASVPMGCVRRLEEFAPVRIELRTTQELIRKNSLNAELRALTVQYTAMGCPESWMERLILAQDEEF